MHVDINIILSELLKVLVVGGVGMLIAYLKKHIGIAGMKKIENELKAKNAYADLIIKAVEQGYKDLKGEDKLNKAMDWLSSQLGKVGVKVSEDELKSLVEAAVKRMNDEFKKDWEKAVNK